MLTQHDATRRRDDAWRTVSALADKQAVGLLFGTRRVAASRPSQGAHRDQTSARARHAGGQPSPADLVGQAVRLRGLPQASPHGAAVRQVQGRRLLL